MPDLAGADVRVGDADELPAAVIGVMTDKLNGLAAIEDLARFDAGSSQRPAPHPPSPSIMLHDLVSEYAYPSSFSKASA